MTAPLSTAPPVPLDQVEWRVDSEPYERNGKTTCRFVPYIDAAIAARLLDEWVGPGNWSDDYVPGDINGKYALWCHLSIKVGDEWVTKRDVGKPSSMESEKGCVSDAFKRAACLKWGVGRNVYDLPTLFAVCRTYTARGKTVAVANDQTLADLLRQLKARGFDATGGKVRDEPDQSRDDQPEPPAGVDRETGEITESSPSAEGSGRPAVDGASPMERINALKLKGKELPQLREQLGKQGVAWPPVELDKDQQAAFDDVLAAWSEGRAA